MTLSKFQKTLLVAGFSFNVIPATYINIPVYYEFLAASYFCFTLFIYTVIKGSWSLFAFFIWLVATNSLIDELFFDPKKIEVHEYISSIFLALIIFVYKNRWIR